MTCDDMSEAEQVGRMLLNVNRGVLVTYARMEDLLFNAPVGNVAVVILASKDPPAALSRCLEWVRRRWPRSPITVVGDDGGGEYELVARQGGANYLTRPVTDEQWEALLAHVLPKVNTRETPAAEG
jgi:hypothetical protein